MPQFDELAGRYADLLRDPLRDQFASDAAFFIQQKCRIVSRRLARHRAGRTLRVLDAGCGQGVAFQFFASPIRVYGCDVSQPMLREAVAHGPVAVQEPYSLPFADDTFDAVYAFCVYHHLPADAHLTHLRELRRVVAPGGEVMVFEHNPFNPVTRRIFARAAVDRGCTMIRPAALRGTFEQAGLRGIGQGYLLFTPERVHNALPFVEQALHWVPLGGQYFVAGCK